MCSAVRFVPAVCPNSRKPPRELRWKTDPERQLKGLRHHLEEGTGGVPLEQSGVSRRTWYWLPYFVYPVLD